MSSSSGPRPGPLTTIFTPPADCYSTPDVWQPCAVTIAYGSTQTRCYWSLPYSCYPFSAGVGYGEIWGFETTPFASVYEYSPGVLPSGYVKQGGLVDGVGADTASACISGFTSDYYCTSEVTGQWVNSEGSTSSGNFKAILPQLAVSWQASDLSLFTPASAPVLPTQSIEKYESSVAARSRTSNNVPSTTAPSHTRPTEATQTSNNASSSSSGGGLSTGAKAGIGVGVAVGVLLVLAVAVWLFWRRKKKQRTELNSRNGYNGLPYNRGTAELPNSPMKPKELSAEHELREIGANRNAPPVPVASKPRFHTELE